jgi:nucleotide-binding universal stress UspA family protein
MMPFRRILFPVDFSEAAVAMVPYVREMAGRFGATVTLLNAFDLVAGVFQVPGLEPAAIPYTPAFQELRDQREQRLEEFSRVQFPGLACTRRLADGEAAMAIQWVAERESTDLIMMPTKGLGRFRRLLVGSVTAKVLHDARCAVWTSAHEPGAELSSAVGYRSIVCAVELDSEADVVLRAAGFLARAYSARVCLLHIEPSSPERDGQASARTLLHAFEQASDSASQEVAVAVTTRVLDADIPEGIRRTAADETADLVVVGRGHEKGDFSRMWSHLYTIIRESPCPVLSV